MAILATFEETELNRLYTEHAIGGPGHQTGIVGNGRAIEQRHVNWYDAVRTFTIQFGGLNQTQKLSLEEFFLTKRGKAIGFRFYPPSDRNFQDDVIGIGDGSNTEFYLCRNYRDRSVYVRRRIVKPVKDTLSFTANGAPITPANVDWDEGIVTFSPAPALATIIRCYQGQYDVPVYFNVDDFQPTDYGFFADWDSIALKEILPSQLTDVGLDETPLSLSFVTPHSDDVFESTFDVTLNHVGCGAVHLWVEGSYYSTDNAAPFSFSSVPVVATPSGIFHVVAVGVDGSGNFVEAGIYLRTTPAPVGDTLMDDDGGLLYEG